MATLQLLKYPLLSWTVVDKLSNISWLWWLLLLLPQLVLENPEYVSYWEDKRTANTFKRGLILEKIFS